MMRSLALIAAAMLPWAAALSLSGETYYVAPPPSGDDGNPGTLGSPWATLQHAADTVQPGDTVLVRTGGYAGAHFTTSGTAAQPIVVRAFPGEDAFSTDGGDTAIGFAAWQALGYDANSELATQAELFSDPAGDDYHLKEGSPAVDAGETLADVPTDLEGTPRPVGPTFDVGAYEGAGTIFVDGFESGDTSRWSSSI